MQRPELPIGFISRHGFTLLFAVLLVFLVTVPIVHQMRDTLGITTAPFIEGIAFTLLMVVAGVSVSKERIAKWIAVWLAVPAIALSLMHLAVESRTVEIVRLVMGGVFLSFVIGVMLHFIFRVEQVTYNTVCASLCIYILLGVVWAFAYSLTSLVDPLAFASSQRSGLPPIMQLGSQTETPVLYFSFTTLTTLGFGDIVPTKPISRMLAATEAITGQLFLTVLVARLVGIHITQTLEGNKK